MPDIEDLSDSDDDDDQETNIVNGHICNNVEHEEETKEKPKPAQVPDVPVVAAAIPIKQTKPKAAPKAASNKKGKFNTRGAYHDDYDMNDYDSKYDDYDDFM